jgi:hypothetical protein
MQHGPWTMEMGWTVVTRKECPCFAEPVLFGPADDDVRLRLIMETIANAIGRRMWSIDIASLITDGFAILGYGPEK